MQFTAALTMLTRSQRLALIERLVANDAFATQADLVDALAAAGVEVTQSSVSRDIKALGLVKTDGAYALPRRIPAAAAAALEPEPVVDALALPWSLVTDVLTAGPHMVVVRCHTATAQQLAVAIDAAAWPGIAGTIAGDDTVFVATSSAEATAATRRRLLTRAGL